MHGVGRSCNDFNGLIVEVFFVQEEGTYYLVGGEALVDNEEMVHHYVVTSCTNRVDESKVGEAAALGEGREENCTSTIWAWAPGGIVLTPC